MNSIDEIAEKIDRLVLDLLVPLRTSKTINTMALTQLNESLNVLQLLLETEPKVPKKMAGQLWFIFTSMLAEAEHARNNREQIETVAWDIQERLRRIFGPRF